MALAGRARERPPRLFDVVQLMLVLVVDLLHCLYLLQLILSSFLVGIVVIISMNAK